jgi:hypothetical protein
MSRTAFFPLLLVALVLSACEAEPARPEGFDSSLDRILQRLEGARHGRWRKVQPPLLDDKGLIVWRIVVHEFPSVRETATAAWCFYVGELMDRYLPGRRWLAVMAQGGTIVRTCEDGNWRSISHPFLNPGA